jgi:hypothetical protein
MMRRRLPMVAAVLAVGVLAALLLIYGQSRQRAFRGDIPWGAGLNISVQTAQATWKTYSFRRTSDVRSQPAWLGSRPDSMEHIELIGPEANLLEVMLQERWEQGGVKTAGHDQATTLLHEVLPQWPVSEIKDWLVTATASADAKTTQGVARHINGKLVVVNLSQDGGTLMLTVVGE